MRPPLYVVWGLDGPTYLGVYPSSDLQQIFLCDASCPIGVLWVEPLEPPQPREMTQQQYFATANYVAAATARSLRLA